MNTTHGCSAGLMVTAVLGFCLGSGCGSETPAGTGMTSIVGLGGSGAAAGGKGGAGGAPVSTPPSTGGAGMAASAGAGASVSGGAAGMSMGTAGQAAAGSGAAGAMAGGAGAMAGGAGGSGAGAGSGGSGGAKAGAGGGSAAGMGLPGTEGFAGMMTAAGTCSGETPHGCFTPAADNAMTCPKTMPEQSAEYPPQSEWKPCPTNGLKCVYDVPGGSPANCSCDLTVHWLCDYPECAGAGNFMNPQPLATCMRP